MPPYTPFPKYGVLNDIQKPWSQSHLEAERFNSAGSLKKIIKDFYTPNSLSHIGDFKGIVLRVEDSTLPEAGSWQETRLKDNVPLLRIKVRIPELHSMLPIPSELGSNSKEFALIDMYPTFVAVSDAPELKSLPEIGSLVWVNFTDRQNFTGPIYIRPIKNTSPSPALVGQNSGQGAFGVCPNPLPATSPKGDELPGKNKALSHSGLPLLPRKPASAMVGENIIVKGPRYNQLTVSTWEKEIKANNIPGRSWIGVVKSNGLNDTSHKLGKRETIIYASNVADFGAPIELIYYFHGFKGFSIENFQKRYPQNIKTMINDGRNFVLVIPELSWSIGSNKAKENSIKSNVWKGTDNFVNFHNEVKDILKGYFNENVDVQYVTIASGDSSLRSISAAFDNGLESIKPNRFIMTEFDASEFEKFLNKEIDINLIVKKGSINEKNYNAADSLIKNKISMKSFDVENKALWDMVIPYVSEEKKKDSLNQPEDALPAPKNADTSPSSKPKVTIDGRNQTNDVIIKDAVPFKEARVAVSQYASLQGTEGILVPVSLSVISNPPQLLHTLANKRLVAMNNAWKSDNPGYISILISGGYRQRKDKAEHEAKMYAAIAAGKYKNMKDASNYIAFESPHETGLAFDIGSNGLSAYSGDVKTRDTIIEKQKQTKLYKWLMENAYKFGITPYMAEPWHWEIRLPRESWASGEEFTNNLAVRVENPGKGGNIPMATNLSKNCINTVGNAVASLGSVVPIGEIEKPLSEAKKIDLLWSKFAQGSPPSVSQLVSWARIVDGRFKSIIQKFQGSIPYSLICVRSGHETRGKGDKIVTKCCGEISHMQVWHGSKFAETRNINDATGLGAKCAKKIPNYDPFNPEHNFMCGLADWNDRGKILSIRLQKYFPEPDASFWAMVNSTMSIGSGATEKLIKLINPTPGNVLNDMCKWIVDIGPNLEQYRKFFGSQSASLIARRVLSTAYWIEAARQFSGKDLYSSNFGLDFNSYFKA